MSIGISPSTSESPVGCSPFRVLFLGMSLALGICAVDSKSVFASCGDYLEHSGPTVEQPVRDFPLIVDFDKAPTEPAPCPCHGPMCRQAPPPSFPLSPAPNVLMDSQSGWQAETEILTVPSQRFAFLQGDALDVSEGYPLRIEHPPRG